MCIGAYDGWEADVDVVHKTVTFFQYVDPPGHTSGPRREQRLVMPLRAAVRIAEQLMRHRKSPMDPEADAMEAG